MAMVMITSRTRTMTKTSKPSVNGIGKDPLKPSSASWGIRIAALELAVQIEPVRASLIPSSALPPWCRVALDGSLGGEGGGSDVKNVHPPGPRADPLSTAPLHPDAPRYIYTPRRPLSVSVRSHLPISMP